MKALRRSAAAILIRLSSQNCLATGTSKGAAAPMRSWRTDGVENFDHALIKIYDVRLWTTERRNLVNWDGMRWADDYVSEPFEFEIVPLGHVRQRRLPQRG